jgi:hypothetical protein
MARKKVGACERPAGNRLLTLGDFARPFAGKLRGLPDRRRFFFPSGLLPE